jgi:hypothetical protein
MVPFLCCVLSCGVNSNNVKKTVSEALQLVAAAKQSWGVLSACGAVTVPILTVPGFVRLLVTPDGPCKYGQ